MMNTAQRLPVLMYHRVGEPDHKRDVYCIHPDRFAAHMRALNKNGYQAVSIEDFDAWRNGAKSLPQGAFVLTFDDGFTGVRDFAAPLLREMGWPATVFLVTGKLGGDSNWQVTVDEPMRPHPLMAQVQIRELIDHGFSLHSHSAQHHDLTKMDPAELLKDLLESREAITALSGRPATYLAYPYGRHDEKVRSLARQAGYVAAFTVESGFNRPEVDAFRIRRLDVFGTDTPAMLLRKIRLGSNDGRLTNLLRYYVQRLLETR
ncbi:MAG: polysaccharide deacetylase family protein [Sulfuriferula multivorans]|uniref:Polysaccharide deacetylase family protein n=1 Tax=Sulfuriferula multivorans TaxID=1559896 RepID=A0A7C9NYL6_9PROT|nr:polysaccharide deacetylase family protein [Sulfuriferula multivorans]